MRTTLQAMLEHIESRNWSIRDYGAIRCASGLCPIVAAAHELTRAKAQSHGRVWDSGHGRVWDSGDWSQAANAIGLTIAASDFIIAVDNEESRIRMIYGYDIQRCSQLIRTRRRVLKALGLEAHIPA